MRTLQIASREIREKAMLTAAAAVLGLMLLAAPGFIAPDSPDEVRTIGAYLLLVIFVMPLATLLGATAFGPELSNRRLGFYLARPVSTTTLWMGKLGGAIALALLAMFLTIGPALLAEARLSPPEWRLWSDEPRALLVVCLAVVALTFVGHAIAIARASRSWSIIVDAIALAIGTTLAIAAARRLLRVQAEVATLIGVASVLAIALVALIVSGWLAIHQGRSDPRRVHRWLTASLWPPLLLGALGFTVFTGWALNAGPEDLDDIDLVFPAPAGNWVYVTGSSNGRLDVGVNLLVELESRRFVRPGPGSTPVFSGSGRRAAWLEFDLDDRERHSRLMTLDLEGDLRPVATTIGFSGRVDLALDHDGRRLAAATSGTVTVYTLPDATLIASLPIVDEDHGQRRVRAMVFRGDQLRVIGKSLRDPNRADAMVIDLDLVHGKVISTTEQPPFDVNQLWSSVDGATLLLSIGGARTTEYLLIDTHSGAVLSRLAVKGSDTTRWPQILVDGRAVVPLYTPDVGGRIAVLGRDGNVREHVVGDVPGGPIQLGSEILPGSIGVILGSGDSLETRILNLASGTFAAGTKGLRPMSAWLRWRALAGDSPTPGSPGARLFVRGHTELVRLDSETMAITRVLGRPAKP